MARSPRPLLLSVVAFALACVTAKTATAPRRDQAAMLKALPDPGPLPPVQTTPSDGPPLRIAAVGDVHMGRAWPAERASLPPDGAMHLFDAVKPSLQDADVTFGNLET